MRLFPLKGDYMFRYNYNIVILYTKKYIKNNNNNNKPGAYIIIFPVHEKEM